MIQGMKCLRPLKHWDCEFESHPKHGCQSAHLLFIFSSLDRGLGTVLSPVQGALRTIYKIDNSRLILRGNRPEALIRNVAEKITFVDMPHKRFCRKTEFRKVWNLNWTTSKWWKDSRNVTSLRTRETSLKSVIYGGLSQPCTSYFHSVNHFVYIYFEIYSVKI
jgi:hypothetical protein